MQFSANILQNNRSEYPPSPDSYCLPLGNPCRADPGFSVGVGTNPYRGRERQHTILPNVLKTCMKFRKFWAVEGAHAGSAPQIRHCLTTPNMLQDHSLSFRDKLDVTIEFF